MRFSCQDDWTGSSIRSFFVYLDKLLAQMFELPDLCVVSVNFSTTTLINTDQRKFEINLTSQCPESVSETKTISDS